MKLSFNYLLVFFGLLTFGHIFAYKYDFSNFTDITLLLKIRPWGVNKNYYQIVKPDAAIRQEWEGLEAGGACLASISWAPWKGSEDIYNYFAQDQGVIPNELQDEFDYNIGSKMAMTPIQIIMEDSEIFKTILATSKALAAGIDTTLCQVLSTVKDFSSMTSKSSPLSNVLRDATKKSDIELNKETTKTIKERAQELEKKLPILPKPKLEEASSFSAIEAAPSPEIKVTKTEIRKTLNELHTQLQAQNRLLYEDILDQKSTIVLQIISEEELNTLRKAFGYGATGTKAAIILLNKKRNELAPPIQLDLEGSIILTSLDAGTKNQACRFGLDELIYVSAELAGGTLCKNRPFVIVNKLDPVTGTFAIDPRTRRPILQAITIKGE